MTHKEKKRKGTFGGDPMVTQVTQQLQGGVAVVVCMDGRWRSSRAGRMEGRVKGPDKGNAEREREEREEVK